MTAPPARPPARAKTRSGQRPFGQWPVGERSLLTSVLGIPPLAAVGLAFGFTALGLFVDLQRVGTVGGVFQALYFTGCVLAMTWVRRRNLFGPLIQPPLLLAVAVPVIVLLGDGANTAVGTGQTLLVVGAPLVNSFPTMAVTTGVVLALGAARFVLQRAPRTPKDDERPARKPRKEAADRAVSGPRDSAATRGAARRPGSPPRS